MTDTPQRLRRGLFGYRANVVHQILDDRASVLRLTEERVRMAEANLLESDAKLSVAEAGLAERQRAIDGLQRDLVQHGELVQVLRIEVQAKDERALTLTKEVEAKVEQARALHTQAEGLQDEIDALQIELKEAREARAGASATSALLMEEIGPIITAAEQSARQIREAAKRQSDQQVEETYRLWRSLQSELARFGMWRDQVESTVAAAQAHFEDARVRLGEVSDRIREALGPMAEVIDVVNEDLAKLAGTSIPAVVVDLEAEATPVAAPSQNGSGGSGEGNGELNGRRNGESLRAGLDWGVPTSP